MPLVLLDIFSDGRLVPLGLAVIAIFFLMSSMRRLQNRQQHASRRDPATAPREHSVGGIQRDLDELLIELQELSRRISAEIDTRFIKLESAMRDADRRIAVLHRLSRQAGAAPFAGQAGEPDQDARHAVIYELADAGFTPVEIARDLGRTPGEVELILNLRKQKS